MILVFGADGQLGRELAEAAALNKVPLTGLGSVADIADREAVAAAIGRVSPSMVINAAGFTRVDDAETDPDAAERANALGPAVIAAESARHGIPLVQISTDYVFDGLKGAPYVEDDAPGPVSRYGLSKLAGEVAVRDAQPRHMILRTGWLFGVHGRNFLVRFLARAERGEPLRVVADRYGSPTAARDLAEAILRIAPRLQSGEAPFGTYHFAGGERASWHALAAHALKVRGRLTGRQAKVEAIPSTAFAAAARRPLDATLDSRRFTATFGFAARPWREGVEAAIRRLTAAP